MGKRYNRIACFILGIYIIVANSTTLTELYNMRTIDYQSYTITYFLT